MKIKDIPPQPFLWQMKDKSLIRLCDMHDQHLLNAINMIRKRERIAQHFGAVQTAFTSTTLEDDKYGHKAIRDYVCKHYPQDVFSVCMVHRSHTATGLIGEALRRGIYKAPTMEKMILWMIGKENKVTITEPLCMMEVDTSDENSKAAAITGAVANLNREYQTFKDRVVDLKFVFKPVK
jgi:hypothetical protein